MREHRVDAQVFGAALPGRQGGEVARLPLQDLEQRQDVRERDVLQRQRPSSGVQRVQLPAQLGVVERAAVPVVLPQSDPSVLQPLDLQQNSTVSNNACRTHVHAVHSSPPPLTVLSGARTE